MTATYPKPRLLPREGPLRWGVSLNGVSNPVNDLQSMCDYGAKKFHAGECDLVNFECVAWEAETIKAYMQETHPTVAYAIGPAHVTLARAIREWEKANEPA